jgi:hypothetical protein
MSTIELVIIAKLLLLLFLLQFACGEGSSKAALDM